jgi:hypothetical protein
MKTAPNIAIKLTVASVPLAILCMANSKIREHFLCGHNSAARNVTQLGRAFHSFVVSLRFV